MNEDFRSMLVPALIGGSFLGVTSAIPVVNAFNCACCMLVIGGGMLATYFYLKDYPPHRLPMSYGDGLLLGLLTGLIGAVIWTVVQIPAHFLMMQAFPLQRILEEALREPDLPEPARGIIRNLLSGVGSGALMLGAWIWSFFWHLIIAGIFAPVGAVIGVALFGQKKAPGTAAPGAPPTQIGEEPPPPGPSAGGDTTPGASPEGEGEKEEPPPKG